MRKRRASMSDIKNLHGTIGAVSYTHLDVYKRQIWDDDMVIPESTLEAVAALKANGHLEFICTGRARALSLIHI